MDMEQVAGNSSSCLCLRRRFFLHSSNVQSPKSHAAVVIKPHHNSVPLRVNVRMIRAGHPVTRPATCNNLKCLKWSRVQKLDNVRNHGNLRLIQVSGHRKPW